MDTITHLALGACIGEVLGGKRLGKKTLVLGALAQSIPDIDFVCSLWLEPSSNILAHRGFTHSFLFALLITPLFAWLARRRWGSSIASFNSWLIFFGVQILVHTGLDTFNAYGTGLFEPFSHQRISFHTLFVADPFFSVSLGLACIPLIVLSVDHYRRIYWALAGIMLSTFYLGYAMINKSHINAAVNAELDSKNIPHTQYFTTPTPFNNWLWFIVASGDSGSYVGYRSVFDTRPDIDLQFFPRNDSLLVFANDQEEVDRLKLFSQGYYTVEQQGDTLIFNDLRFGQMIGWQKPRAGFVFHYYLRPALDNTLVLQRGRFADWDKSATESLIRRTMAE